MYSGKPTLRTHIKNAHSDRYDEIYKLIKQLTDNGIAVIMISSELPEILGMSDRILVLSKGKQTALLSKQEATQENIMRYAVH